MNPDAIRTTLQRPLAEHGPLPPGWEEQIHAYLALLSEWNRRVNLVSRPAADRLVETQLLPSLAAILVVPPGEPLSVLDVGAGGGFPGIPLKVLRPEIRLDLVDSRRKKTDFLAAAVRELDLPGTRVHWCRIETPPEELVRRAPFARAFARAVGSQDLLKEALPPLLAPGASAWAFTAPGDPADLPWPATDPVTALHRLVGKPA